MMFVFIRLSEYAVEEAAIANSLVKIEPAAKIDTFRDKVAPFASTLLVELKYEALPATIVVDIFLLYVMKLNMYQRKNPKTSYQYY